MKIVFVSNYFNHHQRPLAQALYRLTDGNFHFIATSEMRAERRALGYGGEAMPDYVCHAHQSQENWQRAQSLINEADVVIAGSAPEALLRSRIRAGKLLFRYAERPLKKGLQPHLYLPRLVKWHARNPAGKPIYLLAASAYTAGDYARFGLFRGRTYRWGYFPELKQYPNIDALLAGKDPARILWCGRFLSWKHPDDAILAARKLRQAGYDFTMELIGTGEMEQQLRQMIREYGLEDCVSLPGPMKPEEVRQHMERAGIFLMTSDHQEGWGAVLNEAMNSGCAVVASHAAGAVPFLVRDGENGLVFQATDRAELCSRIKSLLDAPGLQKRLATTAYCTIADCWNADTAAQRLICLADALLSGHAKHELFHEGPCSPAAAMDDNWYEHKN